jgi:hypothetical protein
MEIPCFGPLSATPAINEITPAAPKTLILVKNLCLISATFSLLDALILPESTERRQAFQTFSLEDGAGLRITNILLDRFLACMKPASITNARFVRAFFWRMF